MLKVVKRPPPATVATLRCSGTKGKVEEKMYHRHSTRLLKFGLQKTPRMKECLYKFFPICKAGSSILSYGLFWGIIYGITAPFLKITLNASSSGTTTLVYYYLTWLMEPMAGLVFGCLSIVYISSPQVRSPKRTGLFWATLVSAALLFSSSILFFVCIPTLNEESSNSTKIIPITIFTVILFAAMMVSINGYMSVLNLVAQPEANNAAHYGLAPGFNAVGQMIATGIIIYFCRNNSVDNAAPAIFGVSFVFISIFIIISLTCGQYWPCGQCCKVSSGDEGWEEKVDVKYIIAKNEDESKRNFVAEEEEEEEEDDDDDDDDDDDKVSIWLVFLFVIACWIALFAFLPWSVDWYASTYYSDKVGSPKYNRGVEIASWARFYQQLVMAGCSFFMLFVSKCFFKNNHQSNSRRRQEKLKLGVTWIFTLTGLTVYSGCLFVAAFTDNPNLTYAAFVVSGIGMAAIFPLNGLQTYHIFSWLVRKREHTTTIMNSDNHNHNHNHNKTVAAPPPPPFACTHYYDHRQKINAAAMIGQIIILSVAYFAFHFNYKWLLVTGGTASGIAIFLGMLLIVVRSYNFENMIITDRVVVVLPVNDSAADLKTGPASDDKLERSENLDDYKSFSESDIDEYTRSEAKRLNSVNV
jgi:hypothetical protein